MNIDDQKLITFRADRRPICVHTVTEPALANCWSINISQSGVGLVANAGGGADSLRLGDPVDVELSLPDNALFEAKGTVAWKHETPALLEGPGGTVAIGVQFERLPPAAHLALERFLSSLRFTVVCLGATLGQRDRLTDAAAGFANLVFASHVNLSDALSLPGETAGLVICDVDAERGAQRLREYAGQEDVTRDRAHLDWGPRVLFYGSIDDAACVERFNHGRLAKSVPLHAEISALRHALLQVCREHEVRVQQRRATLDLARIRRADRNRGRSALVPENNVRGVVAESAEMKQVLALAMNIARYPVSVLLQGETGTGKEVMSRFIHDESARAESPFVVQDCGTLSETLLESELFGHVKGSFTGATNDHPGLFALADGGTVFLDEVENTTPALQAKLLRVLEAGEIRQVGGTRVRNVDVRIICATNRDLAIESEAGRFRSDLYYRLCAFPLLLPALRERPADIVPLANAFLRAASTRLRLDLKPLDDAAQRQLIGYHWPGNARELRNVVERALILAGESLAIGCQHLPDVVLAADPKRPVRAHPTLRDVLDRAERDAIRMALDASDGVLQKAALLLDVNRVTLARKAKRLGLISGGGNDG